MHLLQRIQDLVAPHLGQPVRSRGPNAHHNRPCAQCVHGGKTIVAGVLHYCWQLIKCHSMVPPVRQDTTGIKSAAPSKAAVSSRAPTRLQAVMYTPHIAARRRSRLSVVPSNCIYLAIPTICSLPLSAYHSLPAPPSPHARRLPVSYELSRLTSVI